MSLTRYGKATALLLLAVPVAVPDAFTADLPYCSLTCLNLERHACYYNSVEAEATLLRLTVCTRPVCSTLLRSSPGSNSKVCP